MDQARRRVHPLKDILGQRLRLGQRPLAAAVRRKAARDSFSTDQEIDLLILITPQFVNEYVCHPISTGEVPEPYFHKYHNVETSPLPESRTQFGGAEKSGQYRLSFCHRR